jgi:hypothetical protein
MSDTKATIVAVNIGRTHLVQWKGLSGIDFGKVIQAVEMRSSVMPLFPAANAPTNDGLVYRDDNGNAWVRADHAVATRPGPFPGPDVAFVKEVNGNVSIEIVLHAVVPPGTPAGAGVIGHLDAAPRIVWQGGQIDLPMPTPFTDPANGVAGLRMLQPLTAAQVADLFGAMTNAASGTVLRLDYRAEYRVATSPVVVGPSFPPREFPGRHILDRGIGLRGLINVGPILAPAVLVPGVETGGVGVGGMLLAPMRSEVVTFGLLEEAPMLSLPHATGIQLSASLIEKIRARGKNFDTGDGINVPDVDPGVDPGTDPGAGHGSEPGIPADPRQPDEESREERFSRTLSFFFDRTLDQNVAIYRAINGASTLDKGWSDTPFGVVRPAEFANTLYLLPHEIRLAYDAARGLPHMLPVAYEADDGSRRIRVILRAEPWYDLEQVAKLQAALAAQTFGGFLAPDIIAGGVDAAHLSLRTIFPEAIEIEDAAVDLRGAFDLTLDFSEEYYSLFVTFLTGPVGLTGGVEAVLTAATETAAEVTRVVPVTLAFGRLGHLPLEVEIASAAINPDQASVRNAAAHPVTIEASTAILLQIDRNAVLPAGVIDANVAWNLPLRLDPGGSTAVTLTPIPGLAGMPVWNAVALNLTRTMIEIDPQAALRAIHALAPAGSLGWALLIESPQLSADQSALPFEDRLFAVEVQITLGTGAPMQVTLRAGTGRTSFTIARNLDDLMSADTAVAFLKVMVRARGVYADGFGDWGALRENTGDTVFVFVQPRVRP